MNDRYIMRNDEVNKIRVINMAMRLGDDETSAGDERPEEFPKRDIEGEGSFLNEGIERRDGEGLLHPEEAVEDGAMRDGDGFRRAGGAGGVDDIGEGGRGERERRIGGRERIEEMGVRVKEEEGSLRGREEVSERGVRENEGGRGVVEDELDARWRQKRVDGEEGSAGLERGEESDEEVEGAIKRDGDDGAGREAGGDEEVSEEIGPGVEIGEGEGGVAEKKSGGGSGERGLKLDKGVKRRGEVEGSRGEIEGVEEERGLGRRDELEGGDGRGGRGGDGGEEGDEVIDEARDEGRVEQVRAVFH